jgi:hypothetical protein
LTILLFVGAENIDNEQFNYTLTRMTGSLTFPATVEEVVVEAVVSHVLVHEPSILGSCAKKEHHVGVADVGEHLHWLLELQPAQRRARVEHLDGILHVVEESLVHDVHKAYPPLPILRAPLN